MLFHSKRPRQLNDDDDVALESNQKPIVLLSGQTCIFSHCCRIVIAEKKIECGIEYVSVTNELARLAEHNPYAETPTLVEREGALYGITVIVNFLDERYPHPPLMPVEAAARAKINLMISRLIRDWLQPIALLGDPPTALSTDLRKSIHDGLVALSPLFDQQEFFFGTEYTLIDAHLAPLLWRLPLLQIDLPKQALPLLQYGERLFSRETFRSSLSAEEAELR